MSILLLLIFNRGCESLFINTPRQQPTIPTHRKKDEKETTIDKKRSEQDWPTKKALVLLLKPVSHTPSNTGSVRSFHRDTERGEN